MAVKGDYYKRIGLAILELRKIVKTAEEQGKELSMPHVYRHLLVKYAVGKKPLQEEMNSLAKEYDVNVVWEDADESKIDLEGLAS